MLFTIKVINLFNPIKANPFFFFDPDYCSTGVADYTPLTKEKAEEYLTKYKRERDTRRLYGNNENYMRNMYYVTEKYKGDTKPTRKGK